MSKENSISLALTSHSTISLPSSPSSPYTITHSAASSPCLQMGFAAWLVSCPVGPVGPVGAPWAPWGAHGALGRGKNNKTRMHVHYIRPKISLCDPASRGRSVAPTGSAHEGSPEAPGEAGRMRGGLEFSSPRVADCLFGGPLR